MLAIPNVLGNSKHPPEGNLYSIVPELGGGSIRTNDGGADTAGFVETEDRSASSLVFHQENVETEMPLFTQKSRSVLPLFFQILIKRNIIRRFSWRVTIKPPVMSRQ